VVAVGFQLKLLMAELEIRQVFHPLREAMAGPGEPAAQALGTREVAAGRLLSVKHHLIPRVETADLELHHLSQVQVLLMPVVVAVEEALEQEEDLAAPEVVAAPAHLMELMAQKVLAAVVAAQMAILLGLAAMAAPASSS
jgi:hypothetical protein